MKWDVLVRTIGSANTVAGVWSGLLFLLILGGCQSETSPTAPPGPDSEAVSAVPVAHTLAGEPYDAGRETAPWIVLVFTQIDCPIANRYVPEINQLAEEYGPQGVHVVNVFPDPRETSDQVAAHVAKFQIQTPVVLDPGHQLAEQFAVQVTPEVVVLDAEKKVRYQGRIDDRYTDFGESRREPRRRDLRLALDALLAGRPVEVVQTEAIGCFVADLK